METRIFGYGGLRVQLWRGGSTGWFTTCNELARACGVDPTTVQRMAKRADLLDKEAVVLAGELAAKMQVTTKGGPKNEIFWTLDGMIFAAMMFRTKEASEFRKEVIGTVKSLEQQGFANLADVNAKIEKLCAIIESQANKIERLEEANERMFSLEASNSGRSLAARKHTKILLQ